MKVHNLQLSGSGDIFPRRDSDDQSDNGHSPSNHGREGPVTSPSGRSSGAAGSVVGKIQKNLTNMWEKHSRADSLDSLDIGLGDKDDSAKLYKPDPMWWFVVLLAAFWIVPFVTGLSDGIQRGQYKPLWTFISAAFLCCSLAVGHVWSTSKHTIIATGQPRAAGDGASVVSDSRSAKSGTGSSAIHSSQSSIHKGKDTSTDRQFGLMGHVQNFVESVTFDAFSFLCSLGGLVLYIIRVYSIELTTCPYLHRPINQCESHSTFPVYDWSTPDSFQESWEAGEAFIVTCFCFEYFVRLLSQLDRRPFVFSLMSLNDILAVSFVAYYPTLEDVLYDKWPLNMYLLAGPLRFLKMERSLRVAKQVRGSMTIGFVVISRQQAKLIMLIFRMIAMVWTTAALLFFLEYPCSFLRDNNVEGWIVVQSDDADGQRCEDDFHNFHNLFYFIVVTFSTVGYGDLVPRTPAGRIFMVIAVVIAVVTINSEIHKFQDMKQLFDGSYIHTRNSTHVVLFTTREAWEWSKAVIQQVLHEDNLEVEEEKIHLVIVQPDEPQEELLRMLDMSDYNHRLFFLRGEATNDHDMHRAHIRTARCVFVVPPLIPASSSCSETLERSSQAAMHTVVAVRRFSPDVTIYASCSTEEQKTLFSTAGCTSVLCLESLRMQLLAVNAVVPGASAILLNVGMAEESNAVANEDWELEFNAGASHEIYEVNLNGYIGRSFKEASWLAFRLAGVTLFALKSCRMDRLMLCPGIYTIEQDDVGFVLAQDRRDAKRLEKIKRGLSKRSNSMHQGQNSTPQEVGANKVGLDTLKESQEEEVRASFPPSDKNGEAPSSVASSIENIPDVDQVNHEDKTIGSLGARLNTANLNDKTQSKTVEQALETKSGTSINMIHSGDGSDGTTQKGDGGHNNSPKNVKFPTATTQVQRGKSGSGKGFSGNAMVAGVKFVSQLARAASIEVFDLDQPFILAHTAKPFPDTSEEIERIFVLGSSAISLEYLAAEIQSCVPGGCEIVFVCSEGINDETQELLAEAAPRCQLVVYRGDPSHTHTLVDAGLGQASSAIILASSVDLSKEEQEACDRKALCIRLAVHHVNPSLHVTTEIITPGLLPYMTPRDLGLPISSSQSVPSGQADGSVLPSFVIGNIFAQEFSNSTLRPAWEAIISGTMVPRQFVPESAITSVGWRDISLSSRQRAKAMSRQESSLQKVLKTFKEGESSKDINSGLLDKDQEVIVKLARIELPKDTVSSHLNYGRLFRRLMNRGVVPLGLQRTIQGVDEYMKDSMSPTIERDNDDAPLLKSTNEMTEEDLNAAHVQRYTVVNPKKDMQLRDSDKVFVLLPFFRSKQLGRQHGVKLTADSLRE